MKTATHAITPEEIMAVLDAELSAERAQLVNAHLNECAECGDIANALRDGSKSVATWIVPAVPANAQFEGGLYETARQLASEQRSLGVSNIVAFLCRHWVVTAFSFAFVVIILGSARLRPAAAPSVSRGVDFARMVSNGAPEEIGRKTPTAREIPSPSVPKNWTLDKLEGGSSVESDGALAGSPREEVAEESKVHAYEPSAPMIARAVSLSILAKDFASSRVALDAILARHHGYAASLTANTQQNVARSLQASLRIPATELNAAMSELKSLGHVQNETQGGEEVTQQHADLVARLENSRETERRLQAILEQRTGKISDVLTVEQEIARVRGEIEQMEAEQKSLNHRVDFASIELTLVEEYKAQITPTSPATSTRIHNSVVRGYRDALESLVGVVLFCAENGPTLLFWLVLVAPIVWLARRRWQRIAAAASMSA
jgi:hypothetical protein